MSRWFYTPDNKQRLGPLTTAQLQQLAVAGTIRPEYMVMREGTGTWMPAAKVEGLFSRSAVAQPKTAPIRADAAGAPVSRSAEKKAATPRPMKKSRRGPIVAVAGCLALLLLSCSGAVLVGAIYSGWLNKSSPSLASKDLTNNSPDKSRTDKAPDEAEIQPELPALIAPAVVAHVKAATVLLHVIASDGTEAEGSGFFALKPGIIITNAHVLGMLGKQSRPPRSVEVALHSGEANETKLTGTVLGVDRDNDLGIVSVEGAALPTPLAIETKRPLVETQKIYVFGFPFGAQLGKNITISDSSISSLRTNGTDKVQQIQINGGIHPGNSGGPLVNTEGKVIGVAVAIIRGTQINFAIPTHFVSGLNMGRVTESRLGEAYAQDGKVSIPVRVSCLDPFAQVKELRVDVWTGMPGQALSGSFSQPKAKAGDGERQTATLTLTKNVGELDVTVPAIPEGQVCWLQPVIITRDNQTHWGPAVATSSPLLPLQRKGVKLAANFDMVPERTVKLKSVSTATFTRGKLTEVATDKIEVDMLEVITPDPKNPFIRISYGPTMVIATEVNGKPAKTHAETKKMFRSMPPSFIVLPSGGLKSRVSRNLNPKLPFQLRADFLDCYDQFCSAVEAAMVPIPERELEPRGKYGTKVALLISGGPSISGGKGNTTEIAKTVDLVLNCTYEGTRTRNGREEAMMTFVGQVKGRSKGTERAKGDVTGKYGVDVESGFVSLVHIRVATEIEAPGGEYRISFALEVDADRRPGNPLNIPPPRK